MSLQVDESNPPSKTLSLLTETFQAADKFFPLLGAFLLSLHRLIYY